MPDYSTPLNDLPARITGNYRLFLRFGRGRGAEDGRTAVAELPLLPAVLTAADVPEEAERTGELPTVIGLIPTVALFGL